MVTGQAQPARYRAAIIAVRSARHARGLLRDRERVGPSISKVGEPCIPPPGSLPVIADHLAIRICTHDGSNVTRYMTS